MKVLYTDMGIQNRMFLYSNLAQLRRYSINLPLIHGCMCVCDKIWVFRKIGSNISNLNVIQSSKVSWQVSNFGCTRCKEERAENDQCLTFCPGRQSQCYECECVQQNAEELHNTINVSLAIRLYSQNKNFIFRQSIIYIKNIAFLRQEAAGRQYSNHWRDYERLIPWMISWTSWTLCTYEILPQDWIMIAAISWKNKVHMQLPLGTVCAGA